MDTTIFSTLFKYCTGSDENFLTDSFVYVLKLLLVRSPNEGLMFLNNLCNLPDQDHFDQASAITISTQVTVEQGRLDIEIKDYRRLVYIEVKHDAALAPNQLEKYLEELHAANYEHYQLVLLTRSRTSALETTLAPTAYHHVLWYQVHENLHALPIQDEVSSFFIRNLLNFLTEKNMSMNRVTWEYMQGVPSLLDLTNTLEEAISEAMPGIRIRKTAGWSWRGFYTYDGFYIGVRLNIPTLISFEDNLGNHPISYKRDLDLNQAHFFSLKQGEQYECLINFLRNARKDAPQPSKDINLEKVAQEDAKQES